MVISIKVGEGKIEDKDNLPDQVWQKSDPKQYISQKDFLLLYTIFTSVPSSHEKVSESVRNSFIDSYEQARKKRLFFLGNSSLVLYGGITYMMAKKMVQAKKGLLGMVMGTILTNSLNVGFLEPIYNKEHFSIMKNITMNNYDLLQNPEYLNSYSPSQFYREAGIQQIIDEHKEIIQIQQEEKQLGNNATEKVEQYLKLKQPNIQQQQ